MLSLLKVTLFFLSYILMGHYLRFKTPISDVGYWALGTFLLLDAIGSLYMLIFGFVCVAECGLHIS